MKIAQVVCVYPPSIGGIGTAAEKLQKILSSHYESFVFTIKNNKLEKNSKDIIGIKPLLKLGHGATLFSLLKKLKKFDIIYFHYPFFGTGLIIWLFKILNPNKKIIIHYHMDVKQKNILYKLLSLVEEIIKKSLFKKSDLIISASLDYIKNGQMKKIYKKYSQKFIEIPFSVNTEEFKPKDSIENKEKTILFVGGLDKAHYFKGINILLQAVALIKNAEFKLKIIGSGDLMDDFKKMAQDLKIADKTIFLGKVNKEELIENYQKAKVLVLPSINNNEAFGIVLIEAMACGTPVIASDLPGVRSVFENNKSGLLIKPGNINDLKNKLEIILNKDELNEMGEHAYQLVKEKYSDEVVKEKIINLIKTV